MRAELMSISEKNAKAIALLDKWLADESGYDERVWPTIRKFATDTNFVPLVSGQPDVIWAAYVVAIAILGVGLMMAVGFLYLVSHSPPEVPGVLDSVGGLILWGLRSGH